MLEKPDGHDLSSFGRSPPRTTLTMKSSRVKPLNGTRSRAICHSMMPKLCREGAHTLHEAR